MNGYLNGDKNYLTEGQNAGSQWAAAAGLPLSTNIIGGTLNVSVTGQATITATASFTGATMRSIFGKLFGFASYPVYAQATSVINTAPYLEVVMMIDNSSSMDIGATNNDIAALEELSPLRLISMPFTQGRVPRTLLASPLSSTKYWNNAATQILRDLFLS